MFNSIPMIFSIAMGKDRHISYKDGDGEYVSLAELRLLTSVYDAIPFKGKTKSTKKREVRIVVCCIERCALHTLMRIMLIKSSYSHRNKKRKWNH